MTLQHAMERLAVAEFERNRLREALLDFGDHHRSCLARRKENTAGRTQMEHERHFCDCGLMDVLGNPFPFSDCLMEGRTERYEGTP
jgi:hypothetical protein